MNLAVAVLLFQAIAAVPAAPETRPLVLRIRDSSKVPVRGARIVVEGAVPAEMALAEPLAKRRARRRRTASSTSGSCRRTIP